MSNTKSLLLTLALVALWSPSFLCVKLALTSFGPFTITALRVVIAAIFLLGIVYFRKMKLPTSKLFWLKALLMALAATAIPFFLYCYAALTIDSALVALLNGTIPIFTALFAQFFFPQERLSTQKAAGIFLSIVGLFALFSPYLVGEVTATFEGILAATIASISYAMGHIWGKKHLSTLEPFIAPCAQLIMSALILVPLALFFEAPFSQSAPSTSAIIGVLALSFSSTALALVVYYKLLEYTGATTISMAACFLPVSGMLIGIVFLHESLTLAAFFAALLIISGLFIVNGMLPSLIKRRHYSQARL